MSRISPDRRETVHRHWGGRGRRGAVMRPAWFSSGLLPICLALCMAMGCAANRDADDTRFLIRVGDRELSAAAFQQIFEISKTAYSHNDLRDPAVNRDIKLRLLNQMVEELILLETAEAKGITISSEALSAAVDHIKQDYPAGVFDEMLMEAAVSFEDWRERLRVRMLTRRVIDTVIAENIVISPEDIKAYFNAHKADWPQAETTEEIDRINAAILNRLRESKTENAYVAWMNEQRSRMPIEINAVQWERVMNKNG